MIGLFTRAKVIRLLSGAQQENEGLAGVWNAPMAGLYTYGNLEGLQMANINFILLLTAG